MHAYGVVTEHGTVRLEHLLPGPIERVWEHLTDSEKRGKWLASGYMDLRPGGPVELKFHHADLSSEKATPERYKEQEGGIFNGTITGCEPPRLLSYTWGDDDGESSEVIFELKPEGDEVLLVVTHRHLPSHQAIISVVSGWDTHLGILEDILKGIEPRPFWTTQANLEQEYVTRLRV